ncbi:MAG: mechanosensitive ion channel [Myxococcales bacterium]|nr:mechanosensitive ion channel [Myxococcales bacterium]
MPEIPPIVAQYIPFALNVLYAILIFVIGSSIAKWAQRLVVNTVKARGLDQALGNFFGSITRYAVLAAAVIAALGKVGVQTTSLVAIFASAGLAVGLALQGSLANFASGVMILFFRPFDLMDVITAAGTTGRVTDIGLFATTLATPDHKIHILPNSAVTGGTIINLSKEGRIRGSVDIGVGYGTDLKKVTEICLAAAAKSPHVMSEPAPAFAFVNMGASSIDFQVHCFTTPDVFLDMLHDVRSHCYEDLLAANVDIPYQTITVLKGEG